MLLKTMQWLRQAQQLCERNLALLDWPVACLGPSIFRRSSGVGNIPNFHLTRPEQSGQEHHIHDGGPQPASISEPLAVVTTVTPAKIPNKDETPLIRTIGGQRSRESGN
jgi:hypothetical protein